MTGAGSTPDPRPQLRAALDQTQRQIDAVERADLPHPTPCAEYDVQTLLAHLVAVVRKLTIVRSSGDMAQVSDPADDLTDDWSTTYDCARVSLEEAWAPDTALAGSYAAAWATMTGHELVETYAHEFTVHSWDLAHAIGRGPDLDPGLAEAALD